VFLTDNTSRWPRNDGIKLLFVCRQIHSEVLEFVYKEFLVFGLVFGLSGPIQSFSHLTVMGRDFTGLPDP